jgi:formylglycine-generating enzyme required for sulfatase activity
MPGWRGWPISRAIRPPEARAAIGRALGRLGIDDRPGVGLLADGLPDINWVDIPGGEFHYQDGERRPCEGFLIARYPVTHAQFQAFLNADDGYAHDRWWRALDQLDRNPGPAYWPIANHPRETVSWFEAMAFCAWLTERLGLADTGRAIRLPTEWEWERAARGTDGRAYPWGSDYEAGRANIDETWLDAGPHHLDRTSPVGIYPRGASPEGVLDLCGNVWEWCLNEYGNPEQTGPGGSVSRVLRGGSWHDDRGYARADDRGSGHPVASTTAVFGWYARPPSAEHWTAGHWTRKRCTLYRAKRGRARFIAVCTCVAYDAGK